MASQDPPIPPPHAFQSPPEAAHSSPVYGFAANVVDKVKTNLVFRSKWAELNGAMGDLGTYIPIVLALTLVDGLNLGTTLIFTGVYNIITGAIYGVPMPVQPMKSIAAAALAGTGFGVPEIMAAGILTGGILIVLGVTGLMKLAYKLIPLSVVRGIQLAQGLSFALTAVKYVRTVQDFSKSKAKGNRQWLGLDGLVLAIVCFCFIVIITGAGEEHSGERDEETNGHLGDDEERPARKRRNFRKFIFAFPSAFIVFVLGVVLAFIRIWAVCYRRSVNLKACMEGRVHQRYNSSTPFVNIEFRDRRLQVVVRSFPGKGILSDIAFGDGRVNERDWLLVWSHAELPWRRRASRAVQVWWQEWWVRGPSWHSQINLGFSYRELFGEDFEPISCWGSWGSALVRWN